ncbi:MFS transporter [Shewanella marisflavi]|uniref:MFS transporter n=1 Tax=Shewanella marisflavi TaxID=260364 RepID=A0AAC9U140_9GAMM|nr:MFS transporter [Shewanella marisflavi]ASJ97277.1 MFS transporter [Shewanella marisflavi]
MLSISSLKPAEHRTAQSILGVTLVVTLISVAGIALPYPVLAPLFHDNSSPLTQFMGLPSEFLMGIVLGIYPLGIIIGGSFIGSWSDTYGRKRLLSLTLVGSAFGYALTALAAYSEHFLLFCLARLLTGICEGNIAIARAIAADLHPQIDKTRSFSLISAMGYGGYLLGPLAGGYLITWGMELVFGAAAIACLLCALLSHQLLPRQLDNPQTNAEKGSSLVLLKEPALRRFFLLYLLLTMGVNFYYEFYPLHLVQQQDFTPAQISWVTVLLTACMIATSIWFTPMLQRKLNHASASLVGITLFGASLACFPYLSNSSYLITFMTIGAGIAIYNSFLPSYLSTAYQTRPQGQLMGMLVTIFCIGNLLAAITGGLLAILDVKLVLLIGAFCAAAAGGVLYHGHFKAQYWPTHKSPQL